MPEPATQYDLEHSSVPSRDRLAGIREAYDVVVIGGGLAGLTGAKRLADSGHKVLLLEYHSQLGGLATWFTRRGGHVFDVSLHGFPVGMVKSCRRYWGSGLADSIVQLKDMRFANPQFSLSTTFDQRDYTRILAERGADPANIEAFFGALKNPEMLNSRFPTAATFIDHYFPGRNDVLRLLFEPIAYANGSREEDPPSSFAIVFGNFMRQGIFTFQGGTDLMINKMAAILHDLGVDIRTRVRVEKIVTAPFTSTEGRHVTGVIANGRMIPCRAVLSNSNLKSTIFDLLDSREGLDPSFIAETKAVRLNSSSCQVYMGIRKGESISGTGDLLFTSEDAEFCTDSLLKPNTSSRTLSFYHPGIRPRADGEERYSIVASTNARWEDWKDLDRVTYRKQKNELIESTLRAIESHLPGVGEIIDHVEAATPKTIQRYTLHTDGASFGTRPEGLAVSQALPTHIPGLYHAGSVGIIMSGWLGTINYGVLTADRMDQYLSRAHPR